ncbi:MAG: hypothetical protein HYW02_07840 [Deltaproteobacteria bacterium]|nr:hypothetical protein [Deltaproteobacteria bacterium]
MTILAHLQSQMEELYSRPHELFVEDFLIDPRKIQPIEREETLFIKERDGLIEIGLYIDPKIFENLKRFPPEQRLSGSNLDSFCTAVEGVSHFLMVSYRIQQRQPISLLELELQGEIDKYLLCLLTLERQKRDEPLRELKNTLFERFSLFQSLAAEEQDRYHLANRLAHQYCRKLEKLTHPFERGHLLKEARTFRQNNLQGKIHLLTNRD